jgi:glycogen(starch) synthase
MNILQYCSAYRPSVGGLEFVVHTLAAQFVKLGHRSRILTPQVGECSDDAEFGVVRRPSLGAQFAAVKWADAIVCHQDVLALAWPLALVRKPALMMIHVTPQQRRGLAYLFMRRITHRCGMNAASRYLAGEVTDLFNVPCGVLPNPYDPDNFYPPDAGQLRATDFVFVGRLAMVKAADVFVEALGLLAKQGIRPTVQIIGDGEERSRIESLIASHSLGAQVKMLGCLSGAQIGDILRCAYCLVVPSHYEPFGIVALEGRACGCELVVTGTGGLPEAAGRLAVIVERSSAQALANALEEVLKRKGKSKARLASPLPVDEELEGHKPRKVARDYLSVLQMHGEASV